MSNATPSRAFAAALYRAAVEGAEPFPRTRDAVNAWLAAPPIALTADVRIHILALGKAAAAMTAGAASALSTNQLAITSGAIVTSHAPATGELGPGGALPAGIAVHLGDHPVPGPASLNAADAITDAVLQVGAGDLAIVLLSGGTTALAAAPVATLAQQVGDVGRAQAHLANLAQTLLESGLAIHEMNAIRRRVLRWGAGRLAVALHARGAAHIAVFAISDVIGDAPEVVGSGPCSPEPLDDATFLALLDAHDLRTSLEHEMARCLGLFGGHAPPAVPPPDHPAFAHTSYTCVARNRDALESMASAAHAFGTIMVEVHSVPLEGDAMELGEVIAQRALHMASTVPRHARAVWIAGGEPVVHLRRIVERALDEDEADGTPDEPMKGGRMQALALAAAQVLEAHSRDADDSAWRISLLAAGTDGRDGPTDAAGAIVDCATSLNARRQGRRRPERDLATGRSWFSLDAAGVLLKTGPTGTNVMDVVAVVIDSR